VGPFCVRQIEEGRPAAPLALEALAHGFLRKYRLREAALCLTQWLERRPDDTQAVRLQVGRNGALVGLRRAEEPRVLAGRQDVMGKRRGAAGLRAQQCIQDILMAESKADDEAHGSCRRERSEHMGAARQSGIGPADRHGGRGPRS